MRPYNIYLPKFKIDSGGIRVMWALYGWLLAKGQIVYVNEQTPDAITIYPEIIRNNPLNGEKIVRYILQTPGLMGFGIPGTRSFKPGPISFNPKDELYVFSRVYDKWNSDDDHILFLPIIDLNTFKNKNSKRTKKAFYVGKGINLNKHPKDAEELFRGKNTKDQQALANYLNECDVLYVYDHLSALMECARLCHCPIKYYGNLSKEQLSLYEPGMNGITYKDEVDVILDGDKFASHYRSMINIFSNRLDNFIEKTQSL